MTRPALIYVSGPMTTGGQYPVNIRRGLDAGLKLMERGYVVIVPHEKAFGMEMILPRSDRDWMAYDLKCVAVADAVYRMADERGVTYPSKGGDEECEYARSIGKPVYYSFDTLFAGVPPVVQLHPLYRVDVGNGSCPGFLPPRTVNPLLIECDDDAAIDAIVEDLE